MKKKKEKIVIFEAIFDYMQIKSISLQLKLFLNWLIIRYPESNIDFPIDKSEGILETFDLKPLLKNLETSEDFDPNETIIMLANEKNDNFKINDYKKEMEKKARDLIKNGGMFDNINIRDKDSFIKINDYFFIMESIFKKLRAEIEQKEWESISVLCIEKGTTDNLEHCILLSTDLMQKYYELIGYWTAKMEKRGKNPGAIAMKKRGERNRKAIEGILNKLGIQNTGIFRKDKKLRNSFFGMVKEFTDLDSEDRILKIARKKVKAMP